LVESDEELVRRARGGDRDAFGRLVERYERPARVVAATVLRSRDEADDAVQDAFVTAFEQLNRLWSPHKFGVWFLQIVRRRALAQRRSSARTRATTSPIGDGDAACRAAPTADGLPDDVLTLIARLPEQECVVVTLRHLDDLPVAEIARVTGRTVGTVTKQLSRAYARMRPWLQDLR
jgi:RNA polymerase sigma-70 factor (ECF subfamily)